MSFRRRKRTPARGRMTDKQHLFTCSCQFERDMLERLRELAVASGVSLSEQVRRLIAQSLESPT
jgi:hypothetical protein